MRKRVGELMTTLVTGALLLSLLSGFSFAGFAVASGSDGSGAPPNQLRINLLKQPFGVNKEKLYFSWNDQDKKKSEKQTAYRLVFAKTKKELSQKKYLFDTGWVSSGNNDSVTVPELKNLLADNSLYYWQVQIRDRNGTAGPFSKPQAFTTAVGQGWASTNGLWVKPAEQENVYEKNGWTDYTVEEDITVTSNALGLIFRSQDNKNNYFWQFNAVKNQLNPHQTINGDIDQTGSVNLADKGVKLSEGSTFRVKIEVSDNKVTTSVDTTASGNAYVKVDERELSDRALAYGPIGYRTGRTETGRVDNVKVTSENGEILYQSDFEENETNYFPGCTMADGALSIPNSATSSMTGLYGDESIPEKANFVFLRNEFKIDQPRKIEKAMVSAMATSTESSKQHVYDLYLNGKSVGVGPARENGAHRYYNTYDVTDLIRRGENVISSRNYATAGKSFLVQMTVYYKDGTKQVVVNSGRDADRWKAFDGTAAFGDNGKSVGTGYYKQAAENIDATKYPFGWNMVDFNDLGWKSAATAGPIIDANEEKLTPYMSENTTRHLVDAARVTHKSDREVIDLGKEIIGGLRLSINSPDARKITVRYGEQLDDSGNVKYQMISGPVYEETWTLKKGQQTIDTFGMKNFRYVEILNMPVGLSEEQVKGSAMYQDFDDNASYFTSSNEWLNRLYDFTKYTVKATNQDLYTDSQARERRAYEGDALINALSSYAFEADYSLARHSHEYLIDNPTWPAEYKLFSVEVAWNDYLYTGNKESLIANYDKLKQKLFLDNYNQETGLVRGDCLVDWPVAERDGYQFSDYNTVFNAISAGAYEDMARIAGVVGKQDDRQVYLERAKTIKETMIRELYDPEKGAYHDSVSEDGELSDNYSQHATAWALAYHVFEDQSMADKLTATIKNQGKFRTSIYGAYFVLRGLYQANAGDVAEQLLTNTDPGDKRTYAHVLNDLKATLTPEAWDPGLKGNMTFSHPWGSAPASQIVEGMFGIQPLAPGFDTFQIKLQPGTVRQASIRVPTVKGNIDATYQLNKRGDVSKVTVRVPGNSKAQMYLPISSSQKNRCVVDDQSVKGTKDGRYMKIELGSGLHVIQFQ